MKNCVFTIVSRNYLHFARTLMQSVARHAPDTDRVVVICDEERGWSFDNEQFTTLNIRALDIENFEEFVFRYDILELNTAIKPFAFSYLMGKGYNQVVYFDPDIRVYASLTPMQRLIANNNIVLTPHLTGELDDGKKPDERDILRAGSYNLGYIGVNNSGESRRFISWWQQRLRTHCINDQGSGLFLDQKWIDLVPGLFEEVQIHREPGWNCAYWNLNHRTFTETRQGDVLANGSPLLFFHFSGFRPDSELVSIHQDRYRLSDCNAVLSRLFGDYAKALAANDSDRVSSTAYSFACFGDGTAIPSVLRQAYRECRIPIDEIPGFSLAEPPEWLIELMNRPAVLGDTSSPFVTCLGHYLYRSRPDLQRAFPELTDGDDRAFGGWFVTTIEKEYGLSSVFYSTVQRAIDRHHQLEREQRQQRRAAFFARFSPRRLGGAIDRLISERMVNAETKTTATEEARIRIPEHRVKDSSQRRKLNGYHLGGLNVFGYLHAESGTGEAARSTIRACNAAHIEVAGVDVRLNNLSRMGEAPQINTGADPNFCISLFHINADQTPEVYERTGHDQHAHRYNIGFWFWELESLPTEYLGSYQYLDEIWVASTFCQRAISKHASVPVNLIPLCIDLPSPGSKSRDELDLPEDSFLVFASMDMLSIPERKNPLATLEAFASFAAQSRTQTHLVLKLSNLDKCERDIREEVLHRTRKDNIILIDRYVDRQHLVDLMHACDCYISLHRSEGFGLPLAEAMYLGKPVVGTAWSSNMDFMTVNNSYPVKYELTTLQQDFGPYKQGNVWAEPCTQHAAQSLLEILDNPEDARERARCAAADIRRFNSPAYVGELVRERLRYIEAHCL